MFDTKGMITWKAPTIPEFDPKTGMAKLYELAGQAPALVYYFRGPQAEKDMLHLAVFALDNKGKIDYLLCNRPDEAHMLVKRKTETKINPAQIPMLPEDHEITENSTAAVVPTTRERALYYRDLLAHKLGASRCGNCRSAGSMDLPGCDDDEPV
jgi:hypothetical protein